MWLEAVLGLGAVALAGVAWQVDRRRVRAEAQTQQTRAETALKDARHALEVAQAADAERRRIYRDLHDDVGGKLLSLLYQVQEPAQTELLRSAIQDLRDIVSRSRSVSGSLLEVLALLREESERRLQTLGIALNWRQAPDLEDPQLDDAQAMHLFRIGREALTNAQRHAQPQSVRFVIQQAGRELLFEVTDDGHFFDAERLGAGRGTQNMQQRAQELHGEIAWLQGTQGGTKVLLRFPLPDADPASGGYSPQGGGGKVSA